MSVTFHVQGQRVDYDNHESYLNLANENARDLLYWLGYDGSCLYGALDARDLAERCRERVRLVRVNIDPARPARESVGETGCRCVYGGRAEGYLHDRAAQFLELAERASDGVIVFD